VRLDFRLHDASGSVEVAVEPNRNPESLAKPPFAKDCPVCTATVTYAGEGYKAAIGRVQLVRSTDGAGASKEFEMDPFEPLGPSAHPFCFFGFAPVLFDAPARPSREDLDWSAESFLCFVPMDDTRETRAILGFQLGVHHPEQAGFADATEAPVRSGVGQAPTASASRASCLVFRHRLSKRLMGREAVPQRLRNGGGLRREI
jgi:hypothetical protein